MIILAYTVVRVDWILESKLNGLLVSELVSRLYPDNTNKQQGYNQPRARIKQYDEMTICYAGCDAGCKMQDMTGTA